ncbi:MAG: hypothetical protein JWM95_3816 [Gemmatimonadetes bacterium]|nr:hypothetical protein [Gemmatimonadota bacterium]
MSRFGIALVVAGVAAVASATGAQQPSRQNPPPGGPPPGGQMQGGPSVRHGDASGDERQMGPPGGGGMDAVSMLLAHTGDLKLTDAQVTKLAAIARRTADRRKTMMLVVDSMRTANRPAGAQGNGPDARPAPSPAARAQMEKMRDAAHTDLRDAIAVLTPEQQAQGWEMMVQRGGGRGGPGRQGGRSGLPPGGPRGESR